MKMTRNIALIALLTLPLLPACGIRGSLERPDPIFRDLPDAEDVIEETDVEPDETAQGPRINELGGEIPEAAPTEPIHSSAIGEARNQ
ncbi:MAG: hypothetical protein AAGK23_05385 [Pseudomonadota bacterium]